MERWEAYSYAGAIALCGALYSMIHHPYFYNVQCVGESLFSSPAALNAMRGRWVM